MLFNAKFHLCRYILSPMRVDKPPNYRYFDQFETWGFRTHPLRRSGPSLASQSELFVVKLHLDQSAYIVSLLRAKKKHRNTANLTNL